MPFSLKAKQFYVFLQTFFDLTHSLPISPRIKRQMRCNVILGARCKERNRKTWEECVDDDMEVHASWMVFKVFKNFTKIGRPEIIHHYVNSSADCIWAQDFQSLDNNNPGSIATPIGVVHKGSLQKIDQFWPPPLVPICLHLANPHCVRKSVNPVYDPMGSCTKDVRKNSADFDPLVRIRPTPLGGRPQTPHPCIINVVVNSIRPL